MSDNSSTSLSQTQTGAVSGTGGGINTKNVEQVEIDLPPTMINAIWIIERLLTQAQCHEDHVLYKDYPVVKIKEREEEQT